MESEEEGEAPIFRGRRDFGDSTNGPAVCTLLLIVFLTVGIFGLGAFYLFPEDGLQSSNKSPDTRRTETCPECPVCEASTGCPICPTQQCPPTTQCEEKQCPQCEEKTCPTCEEKACPACEACDSPVTSNSDEGCIYCPEPVRCHHCSEKGEVVEAPGCRQYIDVVMPIIESDFQVAFSEHGIDAVFEFLHPEVHHIYLISPKKEFTTAQTWAGYKETMERHPHKISWVFEETFGINDGGFHYRNVFQQMLKFHIFHNIPTLLDDTVIVDADVRFVKPRHIMMGCNRTGNYVAKDAGNAKRGNPSWNGKLFFETLAPKLNLTRPGDLNSNHIGHHMLFQRDVMLHLHETVARSEGKENFIDVMYGWRAGRVTEYDFYFSWISVFWPERVNEIWLPFADCSVCDDERAEAQKASDLVYLACHDHRRGPKTSKWINPQNSKYEAYCWMDPQTHEPLKCNEASKRFGGRRILDDRQFPYDEPMDSLGIPLKDY